MSIDVIYSIILASAMGPKKGKKRGRRDEEQQLEQQEQVLSKWAQALEQKGQADQPNAADLYIKPTKQVFNFDFSNQRALDLAEQAPKPHRQKYDDYSQEELEELKKLKEKSKLDKQAKNIIKNEKKKEREKEIQAHKVIQQAQKHKQQIENKKVEQEMRKIKNKQSNPWIIPLGLLVFLFFMFFLQYHQQIHERLSKFQSEQNLYQILQADQGITEKQLKNTYKKLVLKYHPDRNPECQNCKQKFEKIMRAWEILGVPEKRKQYDQNSGYIAELKSASTTLTPHNFHYLVEESPSLWMIQVLDSTNTYCIYFAQFWEELVTNYGDFIKFGRIDIWNQGEMASYIPYKFQLFPSVYFVDQGHTQICSFNYERPTEGLRKCLEEALDRNQHSLANQIPEDPPHQLTVYVDAKLRANSRVKAYHKEMAKYFKVIFVPEASHKQATVLVGASKHLFNFTSNSKPVLSNYNQFLQSFVIQEVSVCTFLHNCEKRQCILIINRTKVEEIRRKLPLETTSSIKLPVYSLIDGHAQLQTQINLIKEQFDNLELGVYMDGRIDVGHAGQIDMLKSEHGERLQLNCKYTGWKQKFMDYFYGIASKFTGKLS